MNKYLLVLILCFNILPIWGQFTQTKDTILVNSTPPITQKIVDAYTSFQEWQFELYLTPDQKQKYQALLIEDLKKGRLIEAVHNNTKTMDEVKKSDWLNLFTFHSQQKQKDLIEESTEEMLNNGQIHGDGFKAQKRKEVKNGYPSSAFLLKTLAEYNKPLIGDGNIHTSLFRRQVDAIFEWTDFKITMVAGKKVIEANEKERAEMQQKIVKTWNENKSDQTKLSNFKGWLDTNLNDWLIWRAGEYSFFLRQTTYQRKSQLVDWGHQIIVLAPEMKPYLEQRQKEYKEYVAKMPNDEIKAEFQLKQQSDAKFAAEMQKLQGQMQMNQQTFAQMRQSMLNWHVVNRNIAENIGNTGFVWTIKTTP